MKLVISVTSVHPSITRFRRQFLRNTWPIQLSFLLFTVYIGYFSLPCHYVILLHFSHDRYNWSVFFSKTMFRKTRHFTQEIRIIYDIFVCYHTLYISWSSWIRAFSNKNPTRCRNVSNFIIPCLYEAQHVSGDTPPIIRSIKLHWQPLVLHTWKVVGRVVGGRRQE
jgi:hypothetical protein